MVAGFRSKAFRNFWTKNDASGLPPDWRKRVTLILSALDVAAAPEEMDLPGFGFHSLTGNLAGRYAVTVSRNGRITFGGAGADAIDVDLKDDHG